MRLFLRLLQMHVKCMHVFLSVRTHTRKKKAGGRENETGRTVLGETGDDPAETDETRNCRVSFSDSLFPQQEHISPLDCKGSLGAGRVSP